MRISLFLVVVISMASVPVLALNNPAGVVIRVVEETGEVVTNAQVLVSFEQDSTGGVSIVKEGGVDKNGIYSAREDTSGYIFVRVNSEGYYESIRRLNWHHQQGQDGSFQASGTTNDIVLRYKGSPISMYACSLRKKLPANSEEFIGMDLIKRDWIQPYGEGLHPDVEIKIIRSYTDIKNFSASLELRFPNLLDGIQEIAQKPYLDSKFTWPRYAPPDGYENILEQHIERKNGRAVGGGDLVNQESYYFRVRTEVNVDGEIESALYGKIIDGINFGGVRADKSSVWFKYYLNPTPNDRNLEFDPAKNLFKDLSREEAVLEP